MSLFSRLFRRQAPTPAPQPEQAPAAEQPPPPDPAALAAQRAAEEEEALTAAIAAADQAALASLACTRVATRIGQRAAQAIDDAARLHELIRATRGGKDKQVYRILTAKRDEVLAEQRSAERLEAEIQAASAAIERHSLRPFDALFTPTLEQLERRWSAVAPRSAPELQQHVERHLGRARETIEQYRKRLEAEAARERAAARAADEERTRRELERQAEETAAAEQARAREAERLAQLERQRADEAALRTIVSLVRKALAALDQGSSARAARLRSLVSEQLPAGPALPGRVAMLLQRLDARLGELKDWKTFSVAPKRIELIREMESLTGSELPRPELARRAKALQARFDALAGDLQGRLDAEYDQNIKAKRTLIERAERLANEPDTRASIEQVKTLQRQWQAVGLVPRDEENTLWTAFRQQCDAVFARREQESAAYREGLEANRARGIALCETAEGIAALSGPPLLEAAHRLEALHGEFDTLELPRTATRSLRERFARAAERCAAAVTRQQALEARRVWTDLFEVANCLR